MEGAQSNSMRYFVLFSTRLTPKFATCHFHTVVVATVWFFASLFIYLMIVIYLFYYQSPNQFRPMIFLLSGFSASMDLSLTDFQIARNF